MRALGLWDRALSNGNMLTGLCSLKLTGASHAAYCGKILLICEEMLFILVNETC